MPQSFQGPIFVVGAPRTGTTLVREILNGHPDVFLYDEVHFNERICDRFGARDEIAPELIDRAIAHLVDRREIIDLADDDPVTPKLLRARLDEAGPTYANLFRIFGEAKAEENDARVWGDSSPQDVLYLDVLKAWYPEARIVGLVRDPRAFLASYKNYYRKGVATYHNRYNPLTNSLLWRTYMNALVGTGSRPWREDVHRVSYEALVGDPESEVRALCAFLDLDFRPEMLEVRRQNSSYIAVSQDHRAGGISTGSVGRWRETLTPTETWIVERFGRSLMREFGYEPEGRFPGPGALPELCRIAAVLPGRVYNMLFRNRKPFTWAKVRKVLGQSRRG